MLSLRRAAAALTVAVPGLVIGASTGATAIQVDPQPDLELNLTAECVVGDTLYWRVTNDNDVDVAYTWNGPGAEDGAGTATAGARTYFTTQDAGGANTTIINWDNPADGPDSKTKAHNNAGCVYHVDFEKAWSGADAPDLDGAVLLTASSSLGTAECTSDDGALSCEYTTGDDLHVPFGETYSVAENAPQGWAGVVGLGDGFTGIDGFDDTALPASLTYDVADDRFCVNDPDADFPFNLEKFCTHTVSNEAQPDLELNLTAECVVGDTLYWRVTNDNDVPVEFTWNGPGANDGAGTAAPNDRTYFTTQDAGGANTTIINWDNPADGPDSKTKAHNNAGCVYHVDFEKLWNGDAAPDLNGEVLFTATSSLGTATCTSDDGVLTCTFTTGDDLHVPFGESYTVTEIAVDGWSTTAGTGDGFTGIDGFDEGALPDDLVYAVADDRFCVNNPDADFPFNLEKYCTHTVINTVDVPETTTTTTTEPEPEPEPTIEFSALAPVCIGDFPYVSYRVAGEGLDPDALVTLRFFFDPDEEPVATYADQPLEGSVLWPGASETPPDWPGWEQAADGSWIPDTLTEENEWREQGLLVEASVNPTVTAMVGYPDQTDACDTPRGVLGGGTATTSTVAPAPTVPPTPTVPPGAGLPETGSSSMPIALIALALLGGGLGLVVFARRSAIIR